MKRLTLRDYQEECVAAHYNFFTANHEGHPLFVVPTGGGKSLIIAEFIMRSIKAWKGTRILILTHVKELIEQNYDEFVNHWGDHLTAPAGIYSAGLGRRNTTDQVLFAGIQSVFEKAEMLGSFDLVLIDEAHLVPKKGMGRYRSYLEDLTKINPKVRVCGYTATEYRLDGGYLHKGQGKIFSDIAYRVKIEMLVEQGYLAPVVARLPENVIDVSEVESARGDFKIAQLEAVATEGDHVRLAVNELVRVAFDQNRNHWLIFAIGLKHAAQIKDELDIWDIESKSVFGNTDKDERRVIVKDFKAGLTKVLINVGVLTTGFNAPRCDLIALMRPTQSAALYVQMMGRGMRTFEGKKNCLVLDYGENVMRHGPINKVRPKSQSSGDGAPPMKTCPECHTILMLGVPLCPECGYEWVPEEIQTEHQRMASFLCPLDMTPPKTKRVNVTQWFFRVIENYGEKPDTLRVDYMCGMKTYREWLCFDHTGYARNKATKWWRLHSKVDPQTHPNNVSQAMGFRDSLTMPSSIEVTPDGEFDRVGTPWFVEVEA